MSHVAERLKAELVQLSLEDRRELYHFLGRSLEVSDDEWDDELKNTVQQRIEDIRSGKVASIPADVVLTRLRERHP